MAETLAAQTTARPRTQSTGRSTLDHLSSFRVIYVSVFMFALLYILSVEIAETLLGGIFQQAVAETVQVSPVDGPIQPQIQNRVSELLQTSPWVQIGGVRVNVTVLGADGRTPLYIGGGRVVPPPPAATLEAAMREAENVLPPISDVFVSVSHGSLLSTGILIAYAAVLLQGLFLYNRAQTRREGEQIVAAISARDGAAARAETIEQELAKIRTRLDEVEPAESAQAAEIGQLAREREGLRQKLRDLAEREAILRTGAERSNELEQERQALEELLDEALEDVGQKESEIQDLQDRLKRAAKATGGGSKGKSRSREDERMARRLRTLYKTLDVDDRAIADLVALGDESLKLRAEEALKRLADDPDTAAVRRKVGGLPPQLSIYEIGFAGKGRIYYSRTDAGRHRVLALGGKATQKQDLEYLSRLSI